MLSEQDKRKLKNLDKRRRAAYTKAIGLDLDIAQSLWYLHKYKGATYAELGAVFGVSRQRIHQIVKGVLNGV